MDKVVLFHEMEEIFCRSACEWASVPLAESEAGRKTREFSAMIEGTGSVGPRNWYGMVLRARTERWITDLIERVRARELNVLEQDLHISLSRMPTIPRSSFVISGVKRIQ